MLNDKPSIVADPTDADFVYAVWNRFHAPKSVVVALFNAKLLRPFGRGFHGEFYFTRSTTVVIRGR